MPNYKAILIVALGGALGSIARYLLGLLNTSILPHDLFVSTLCVNVIGSTLIGYLYLLFRHKKSSHHTENFAIVGICGGFTTYSSFMLDNYQLLNSGRVVTCILYFFGTIILSFAFVFIGAYIGHILHHKYA